MAAQVTKCHPLTKTNDLSEAQNLLVCIRQVLNWEEATCSCAHQGLKLFGLKETELSAVCPRTYIFLLGSFIVVYLLRTKYTKLCTA